MRTFRLPLILFLVLIAWPAAAADDADQHFEKRVRPILESRCLSCHGPDDVNGELRLDSRELALKGGERGPVLVPGKPDESLLIQSVKHLQKGLQMPPREKLTAKEIAALERWIRDGAPWPKAASPAPGNASTGDVGDAWSDPRNPIVRIFQGQRLQLWSLKPIHSSAPPDVAADSSILTPVDRFIVQRLERAKLSLAPEADRRTLIRRVSFDLTGLPPTPEEATAFLADESPDAFERLVERLLASPRYGEHWARLWLDVVRYSDSNGFDWDEFRPQAWRFRDYVIRSFNADKPFDNFVREQLAGDELLAGEPETAADQDKLIATGYLRLGPHDNAAPLFNEQDRSRAELLADLTETTGSAFLGLTFACCRCHDHKYDPLSQVDHFRLRAFFAGVQFADEKPLDLQPDQVAIHQANEAIDTKISALEDQRQALLKPIRDRLRQAKVAELPADEAALLNVPEETRTDDQKKQVAEIESKVTHSDDECRGMLSPEDKAADEALAESQRELRKSHRSFTHGLLMTESADVPVIKVLFQGNHKAERDPVEPGYLSILSPGAATIAKGTNPHTTGRRLTLANWIVSPKNPLTARVFVNRVWQAYFGRGLVATPNDFGLAGATPSHPELLDWLAQRFMADGWSLKALHRQILLSATYRQASTMDDRQFAQGMAVDADNVLLWRQASRRLTAEQLRDAAWMAAGRLRGPEGGPPVWPELPPEILAANPAFLDDNSERTKGWYPSPTEQQSARSIYLIQKRTTRVPFLETFDLPDNSVSCARRDTSIVAPQALTLLNNPECVSAARALAARCEQESPADVLSRAFQRTLQRDPTAEERQRCQSFLEKRTFPELCRALLNLNEFAYRD